MTQQSTHFNINMPPDRAAGHYADFAMIWHTPETFVLDFIAATQPAQPNPDGSGGAVVNAEVSARVRIPAAQVWEIMKALNEQYSAWEVETGKQTPNAGDDLPPSP